ncbi:MAG: hypothetical protein WC810_09365 [Janthinobacterium sp.]
MPQVLGSTAADMLAGTLLGQLFLRGAALRHGQRIRFMAWFARPACGMPPPSPP